MKNKKITILGCGWVGKALESSLLKHHHEVHCASKEIEKNHQEKLYLCDIFIIALPPKESTIEAIEEGLKSLHKQTQVILLSSLSLYRHKRSVIKVEALVKHHASNAVILRLGGLMGYDRIAGRYSAGKTLPYNSPTRYIHRDDVIGILVKIIEEQHRSLIFDAVAPIQSDKKTIYQKNAEKFGFVPTHFLSDVIQDRLPLENELHKTMDYTFIKESVHHFWDM